MKERFDKMVAKVAGKGKTTHPCDRCGRRNKPTWAVVYGNEDLVWVNHLCADCEVEEVMEMIEQRKENDR